MSNITLFRVYEDGRVVHQDDIPEDDVALAVQPYDFTVHKVPDVIIEYLLEGFEI